MGNHGGAQVSRYECFTREPSLEAILALEVIYQKPARELFPGLYRNIESDVAAQAKTLIYKTDRGKQSRQTARKRQVLAGITSSEVNNLK